MRIESNVGPPDRGKPVAGVTEFGHLASGVGHHVINALSAIVSNAEILRIRLALPDPPDPSVLADTIIRTALEAASVARRLIDVTRPLTQVGEAPIRLDQLIADFVAERREAGPEAGSTGGPVTWSVAPIAVPAVVGHAGQLRSMVDLLTTNAAESAGPDGVRISLSTGVDGRGWVVLEVKDDGMGMSPEIQERAVEPFFSTKPGHLGVGLSIANGIWRRHKGTLSARSVPGEGTTIRLFVDPSRTRP